ncbi:energy transducer TonB [Coraliomargarita algicola]|uniref:Energy transducer TonB n=1 Tax=Coraliomargarita algicola TaxID=3092156 RepID=A0ABZ0RF26_9BACT|nr:energy transducer TonB [Coraliomargarita sp. J2-16]WPJ94152.1 energy transducer TonB [Coraliomargarita sp. J2-16]
MSQEFPRQNWKWAPYLAIGGACLLAVLLFLLIPLTQMLNSPKPPHLMVREMQLSALPPPPATPPLPEETPPPEPQQVVQDMPSEPTPIDLPLLDVDLSPGNADAIAMGAPMPSLQMQTDTIADIQKMFSFDDLPEVPRLVNTPNFRFPPNLARRGVDKGKVIVEIDILPNGSAKLRRIVSSSHVELEEVARKIIARARFTKPMVGGVPQTVRGLFPLVLQN